MKEVAVIIKHPFRDSDWRIDIYKVDENTSYEDIKTYVEFQMLGPFEVVGMTERISQSNNLPFIKDKP